MAKYMMAPLLFLLFHRGPVFSTPVIPIPAVDHDYNADTPVDYTDNAEDGMDVIEKLTDCTEYISSSGRYRIERKPSRDVCGLFIVAPTDNQIELIFEEFNVDCQHGGLAEVVDGFVHGKTLFPPNQDLPETRNVKKFCGSDRPEDSFVSTGNAIVIQNRMPKNAEYFQIAVKFVPNPKPCNSVILASEGSFVLQNYGNRINCSVLMLFPRHITLTYFDVASKRFDSNMNTKAVDYLEIRGGNDTSLSRTKIFERLSGYGLQSKISHSIQCDGVIVRLVSSGFFDNVVEVSHKQLNELDKMEGIHGTSCSA